MPGYDDPAVLAFLQAQKDKEAGWYAAAAGKPAPPPQDIPISQIIAYQQARGNAKLAYETGQQQNEYNRGNAASRYTNFTYPDLLRKYELLRNKLPGGFAGRGLLNSGLWLQGLSEFNTGRQQALGKAEFEHGVEMGQFDINKLNLERTYFNAMAQIQQQESAARQDLAAQIRAFSA